MKNNVVYRGWAIPANDVDTPAPGAKPDQPEAPEAGNAEKPQGKPERTPAPQKNTAVTSTPDHKTDAKEQKAGSKENKADTQAPKGGANGESKPVAVSAPAKVGKSDKSSAHAGAGVVGLGALGAAVTALGALLVRRGRSEG